MKASLTCNTSDADAEEGAFSVVPLPTVRFVATTLPELVVSVVVPLNERGVAAISAELVHVLLSIVSVMASTIASAVQVQLDATSEVACTDALDVTVLLDP